MSQAIVFLSVPARQQGAYTKKQQQQKTPKAPKKSMPAPTGGRRSVCQDVGWGWLPGRYMRPGSAPVPSPWTLRGAAAGPRRSPPAGAEWRGAPAGSLRGRESCLPPCRPLNLCPRHGAASRGKGAFLGLGGCPPFFFFPWEGA